MAEPTTQQPPSGISDRLKAALREPLAHFLVAGLLLFLFFAWRGNAVDPASRTITIDEAQVERLAASWSQTWQRAPRPNEIDGLIRDYIKDEVYAREAIRLGLDQDDNVIRRRLRNKMEYLARAAVENARPDEATLQKWLMSHQADYATGAQYSFDQIYLAVDTAASANRRAQSVRQALTSGADWTQQGDRISLPSSVEASDPADITRIFGDAFARSLTGMKSSTWSGPVASGFGYHLVRMRAIVPGKPAKLPDVRQAVENGWRAATQQAREDAAFQTLLDGYTIRIAKP